MNIPQVLQGPICRIWGGKAYWQETTASTRSQKRATAAYGISLFWVADSQGAHFALGSWGTKPVPTVNTEYQEIRPKYENKKTTCWLFAQRVFTASTARQ
jgi:hypothetical protein